MKTKMILTMFVLVLAMGIGGCTADPEGAELIAPKELAIKKGFKAYTVTTAENETFIMVENSSPTAKGDFQIWSCKCGIPKEGGDCKLEVEAGSPIALCTGNCNCGFTQKPLNSELVFVSKKLLINNALE